MISLFEKSKNSFFNCLFKLKSSCPSKNYFPQSFPDFYSNSLHGFYSGEKWEVCQSFGDFFFKGSKSSPLKKSLQSLYNLYQILKNLVFWKFLFLKNPKTVFWTAHSNTHQAVLPKTTSHNIFLIFTPSLLIGFILEKNEKFFSIF